ncbi:hypothetical protein K458DRAFT_301514 [Lentithecium fluviatile CBS 122367]|uniref:Uncharacterized protein n=1 Tax=Lentithecium fluviatile CBS 122367 TaxID=1168545 RepID=A0A6G1J451_9PLEO|nr:hypothetical protein K458DRAFT_301514 [Lentithecium fluviatile CBS 122367]
MVSVKKLLVATSLLLSKVAATPFLASTRSVAAAEVRAINDFAIESRNLNDVSDKPEPATNPDAPPPRLGQQQEKPATCRRWKPRSLVRRGQLKLAKDKDNILENEYITAYHVGKGGTASVTDLSGCTALFFYDKYWTPSVYHIFSGEELERSQEAATMVNDAGRDTNGVTIKADSEIKYNRAKEGIKRVNSDIEFHETKKLYHYNPKSGKRFRFTTKPGGEDLEEQQYDYCPREPEKF